MLQLVIKTPSDEINPLQIIAKVTLTYTTNLCEGGDVDAEGSKRNTSYNYNHTLYLCLSTPPTREDHAISNHRPGSRNLVPTTKPRLTCYKQRPILHRERIQKLPPMRNTRRRLRQGLLRRMWPQLHNWIQLQSKRCLSLMHHQTHGRDSLAPRR